jgi:hypothetical protein
MDKFRSVVSLTFLGHMETCVPVGVRMLNNVYSGNNLYTAIVSAKNNHITILKPENISQAL